MARRSAASCGVQASEQFVLPLRLLGFWSHDKKDLAIAISHLVITLKFIHRVCMGYFPQTAFKTDLIAGFEDMVAACWP